MKRNIIKFVDIVIDELEDFFCVDIGFCKAETLAKSFKDRLIIRLGKEIVKEEIIKENK